MNPTQSTPAGALLREWDALWSSYVRGQVPYREVTVWCAQLTENDQEALWGAIQERRRREFEETAWA